MKPIRFALGSLLLAVVSASVSVAQVQRTFVSGLGSDANPCSRPAPCRNFAQAVSQTSPGGEVIVLDSAGYGTLSGVSSITKPLSIIAPPGVYAGVSVFSGDGIVINAGSSDTIILRGLTFNNQGTGARGINFVAGGTLHVEGCIANGFQGQGIDFIGPGRLEVKDSIMRGNNSGILMESSSGVLAAIDNVRLEGNVLGLGVTAGSQVTVHNSIASGNNVGIFVNSSTTAPIQVNLERCAASNNLSGISIDTQSTGPAEINVESCVLSGNSSDGIQASADSTGVTTVRISNSMITNNQTGVFNNASSAVVLSRGNNTIEGNTNNTSGTVGAYTAK